MKFICIYFAFYSALAFSLSTGDKAPHFKLKGISSDINLNQFLGKTIVLEWLNHGCPFVRKHYDSGNMQSIQKKYTQKGIIWLSIISSAPGKQGHVEPKEAMAEKKKYQSSATDILIDSTGKVGKLYGAKTTPHMFIISSKGELVYQGAIDDQPDTEISSIASAKNYVTLALDEVLEGKKIKVHTTKAYGCSVKY